MLIRLSNSARLFYADCRETIKSLPDNSIDSVVTDPPYALVSIVKRFGGANAAPAKGNDAYMRASAGFMGKQWDTGETAFSEEFWAEVLRVLKPGGHVAAFGASRGYHRMACAIEDAGFEIRDSLMWIYGVGFPKSHNISGHETFCQCGAEPATECNVRSLRNADVSQAESTAEERRQVLQSSVSECRPQGVRAEQSEGVAGSAQSGVEGRGDLSSSPRQLCSGEVRSLPDGPDRDGANGRLRDGAPFSHGTQDRARLDTNGMRTSSGSQTAAQRGSEPRTLAGQSLAQDGGAWENCGRCGKPMVPDGLGTALKPAFEPIVLARKPLSEGTVAANVLRWGTGALNIDGCRIGTEVRHAAFTSLAPCHGNRLGDADTAAARRGTQGDPKEYVGRWPANICHDGSGEVVGAFPNTNPAKAGKPRQGKSGDGYGMTHTGAEYNDNGGSAARFFYSAKASKSDRNGSKHPTIKPIALMEWLATLITPPGGTILDPFAGSGTTGAAAARKGFSVVLCEREAEYVEDIKRRFDASAAATPLPASLTRLLSWNRAVASYHARSKQVAA